MFHSVGLENHAWTWSEISEALDTFEGKIALLRDQGFTGVFWHELYEHMAGRRTLPDNSILLTFDDGYLDNWVHVYPILKRYGMKGTIFVTPDFVDPTDDIRPTLDDVEAGHCAREELTVPGFLNWSEMKEMEKSGLVDIQSHAMTHTWYFAGPRIVDFHAPHDVTPHPWMFWNARPDRKPFYLSEDQQGLLPWGYPILEHKKSLEVIRFFPDDSAIQEVTCHVAEQGGAAFFQRPDWKKELRRFVMTKLDGGEMPGSYESDDARIVRITEELQRSKQLIETNLDKSVDYICWPGGANDEKVRLLARNLGYKSWTLGSKSMVEKRNHPGTDPSSIKRIGTSNIIDVKGRRCGSSGPRFQFWKILSHQGSTVYTAGIKAYKLVALARSLAGAK